MDVLGSGLSKSEIAKVIGKLVYETALVCGFVWLLATIFQGVSRSQQFDTACHAAGGASVEGQCLDIRQIPIDGGVK